MTLTEVISQIFLVSKEVMSKEVIIALIAAWMGASATRSATKRANEYATKKAVEDENRLTRNTLLLLKVEMTTAWDIYTREYSEDLVNLAPNEPYLCTFSVGENPFPIYDSAPACLTNIQPETSEKIVRLYMRTKGLIRMIEANNDDYKDICEAGQVAVRDLLEKASSEKIEISEEGSKKLSQFYSQYIYQESKKLGMGGTADAMKLLTHELGDLINSIQSDIDKATKS